MKVWVACLLLLAIGVQCREPKKAKPTKHVESSTTEKIQEDVMQSSDVARKHDVRALGLVKDRVNYKTILQYHASFCSDVSHRHFQGGDTLAYVTPWNGKGYEIATKFKAKFTFISPVWYQIDPTIQGPDFRIKINGGHDVDTRWLQELKTTSPNAFNPQVPKIVPRFLFQGFDGNQLYFLFTSQKLISQLAKMVTQECTRNQYDGIVVELWSSVASVPMLKEPMIKFIVNFAKLLKKNGLLFILVVPPSFEAVDFHQLQQSVERFSVMTYDYSDPRTPGPNAPLPWINQQITSLIRDSTPEVSRKILMGIPFYGYDFSEGGKMEPIVGHSYVDMLREKKPNLEWESTSCEHKFSYRDNTGGHHKVYYPTLKFLEDRLALSSQLGTGISIWEIGQGLDFFYDLL